jgi:allene oxide cyclase
VIAGVPIGIAHCACLQKDYDQGAGNIAELGGIPMTILGVSICRTAALSILIISALVSGTALAEEIAVVERASTDAVTDTGAKGDSAGDLLTFANDIYDRDNKTKLGSNSGWCIRTQVGKSWECFWTLQLEKGSITVHGPFLDAGDSILAITGGTGMYSGAKGDMKLHARDKKGSEYDFVYNLK